MPAAQSDLCCRAAEALRFDVLGSWGAGVESLLDAALSHHGKPWPKEERADAEECYWKASQQYDPFTALTALMGDAAGCYPLAFEGEAPLLPENAGLVHAFAGLVQLADWIASGDWRRPENAEPL